MADIGSLHISLSFLGSNSKLRGFHNYKTAITLHTCSLKIFNQLIVRRMQIIFLEIRLLSRHFGEGFVSIAPLWW